MTEPDFIFHEKVCKSKRQFKKRTVAKHAAMKIRHNNGPWMRPYLCRVCNCYHLQSISKKKDKLRKQQ